jgi:hypothetical protein
MKIDKEVKRAGTYKFPAIRLPCRDLRTAHREIDRVNLNTISGGISCLFLIEEMFVVFTVRKFVEAR